MTSRLRLSLRAWRNLSAKIDLHRSPGKWRAQHWLEAACNSLLMQLQHASHAEKLKATVPLPPIFMIGFWRSGTTFLHELFCCDRRFGLPTTYACLNSAHFLLSEKFLRKRVAQKQRSRPMDNVQYSWESPQEDEFALLASGAPSPYEALLFPSLMSRPSWLLDLRKRSPEAMQLWKESLLDFLRLLTIQQNKPMVLKSPSHGFKLHLLPTIFPQARYVILERNPYEVFASNLRLWNVLLQMYSLEPYSANDVEEFVLAAYVLHEQAIAEGVRIVPDGALARVRYEDLAADPVAQMERLYRELRISDFEQVRPKFEDHASRVSQHKRNRFHLSPLQMQRVEERWGSLIHQKGYSFPSEYLTLAEPASLQTSGAIA